MPEGSAEIPISKDLRDAFEDAVANLANWDSGGPEPRISLERRNYSIGAICNFAMPFSDLTPSNIYDVVLDLAQKFREEGLRQCEWPKDHSYASVARSLLGLYNARVEYYRSKAAMRPKL